MKLLKTNWLLAILLIFTLGCEGFLEEDMQGTYSTSTFYQTEDHAQLALTAIYNITSFVDTNNNLWVFGDVASDDAIKGGLDGDQTDISYIDDFSYVSSNSYLENIWTHYYEGITRANYLLYYLPGIDMDDDVRDVVEGETLFLRSYFYFHLVNIFGEIPLKLNPPISSDEVNVAVSSVATIFAQLDEDLEEAGELLPADNDEGHVSKGGAFGLLAKLRLFNEDYDEALVAIDSVENLGLYSLMPLYSDNFSLETQNNEESLFEVQHLTGTTPKLGSVLNQYFAPQDENGYYFDAPTEDFVDEFEVTSGGVVDPRLDYSVGREGQTWLNGEDYDPTWSPTGYTSKKHLQPLSEVPVGTKGDGGLNYVFMRYAELLLIKAEALNESGSSALALTPLNEVRKRARESYLYDEDLDGYGTVPDDLLDDITTTDQEDVREAIRHERRVELGLEFHRFYDLMRYGATVAEEALSDTEFSYDDHRYFSIPLSEKDINDAID